MQNPLFNRLFCNNYGLKTFTTEVLAGVLRSNQALLDNFVNTVLKIKGNDFFLETQPIYNNGKPDMVFSNEQSLCFLVNQADSFEGGLQLEQYQAILHEQPENLEVYLRYCTQHYNKKIIVDINFEQFFWSDVYTFLEDNYSDNSLATAFLDFLKEHNMDHVAELNTDNLVAINYLNDTLKKMDMCLDLVMAEFTKLFGSPTIGGGKQSQERLRDFGTFKQYHITKEPILHGAGGEWGWSDIRVCFAYNEEPTKLVIWYWCGRTHTQYELLKKLVKKQRRIFSNCPGFVIEDTPNWLVIAVKKNFAEFESETKPLQAIFNWLTDTLRIFRNFADKTPELHWNIPK